MMKLFGFVEVTQRDKAQSRGWCPKQIKPLPLGEPIAKLLIAWSMLEFAAEQDDSEAHDPSIENEPFDRLSVPCLGDEPFGAFQPLMSLWFPQWRNNLAAPQVSFREGQLILKASLDPKVWRRIVFPARRTFDDLAGFILKAFDFDFDHLYEFTIPLATGNSITVSAPEALDGLDELSADEILVGQLPLEPGQAFVFHYDFGDDWMFQLKLESVEPDAISQPRITGSQGTAPSQYPMLDE